MTKGSINELGARGLRPTVWSNPNPELIDSPGRESISGSLFTSDAADIASEPEEKIGSKMVIFGDLGLAERCPKAHLGQSRYLLEAAEKKVVKQRKHYCHSSHFRRICE